MIAQAPAWQLREAQPDDCAGLALIGSATFLDAFAGVLDGQAILAHCRDQHSRAAYERYLGDGARAWIAEAQDGRAPVGFALAAKPDLPGAEPGDVELKRIYALTRFHGTGMASALLEHVIAAYRHARRIVLGVYAQNQRALRFYAKHGFTPIGTRRFDVGGKQYDDQVLARPIAETDRNSR